MVSSEEYAALFLVPSRKMDTPKGVAEGEGMHTKVESMQISYHEHLCVLEFVWLLTQA